MPVRRDRLRHGELDALRFERVALEHAAVAADDEAEEEHAGEVAEEGDDPGLGDVHEADAAVEVGDGEELGKIEKVSL